MGMLYKGDTHLRGFLRSHFNQVYAIKVETWMDTVGKKVFVLYISFLP